MRSPRLVAEVSSNHDASLARALAFVDAAADCGAHAVKFQQFEIERLFAPEALAASPELCARKAWELPAAFNPELAARAHARRILFASTPFHLGAVDQLAPWVDFFKVASYQVLWLELLRAVARTGRPVVLATGMADLDEVRAAVEALLESGCEDLTVLHCVSLYPTPPSEANLRAIATLRDALPNVRVGWSDHTVDIDVVARAVRRFGAELVEFHFDLEGAGAEFRAGHCWLPDRVRALRAALAAAAPLPEHAACDGDGIKAPRPGEAHERRWRTDPSDGLRPLLAERAQLRARAA